MMRLGGKIILWAGFTLGILSSPLNAQCITGTAKITVTSNTVLPYAEATFDSVALPYYSGQAEITRAQLTWGSNQQNYASSYTGFNGYSYLTLWKSNTLSTPTIPYDNLNTTYSFSADVGIWFIWHHNDQTQNPEIPWYSDYCAFSNLGLNGGGGGGSYPGTHTWNGVSPAVRYTKSTSVNVGTVTAVLSPIAVNVSPSSWSLGAGQTQQFYANVTGGPTGTNTQVTWSISPNVGTISGTGLYSAPSGLINSQQSITITATSVANPSIRGSAIVTLMPISVSISPGSVSLVPSQTQQFSATVAYSNNQAVTWAAQGGSITSGGLYTTPSAFGPQTYQVTATSVADTGKTATATVTVPINVVVTISPTVANITVGENRQFTATVTGTTNTAVTWSTTGGGTISADGLFHATNATPATSPWIQFYVTATSVADPSKSSTARVNVYNPLTVTVTGPPSGTNVASGSYVTYNYTLSGGNPDRSVYRFRWSFDPTPLDTYIPGVGILRPPMIFVQWTPGLKICRAYLTVSEGLFGPSVTGSYSSTLNIN